MSSPGTGRLRAFYIICSPVMFCACLGAATWVVLVTRNPWFAAPFLLASWHPARLMRWSVIWLSTPDERPLFAGRIDFEPLLKLVQTYLRRRGGSEGPTAGSPSEP